MQFWKLSTVSHSMATTLLLISKVEIMNVSKIWFVRQRSKESNIFAWHNNICFTVFLSKVFGLSWSCFCLALAACFAVWSLKVDGVFVKLKQEPGPEEDQLFSCSQSLAKKWRCQTFGGKHATNLWAKYLWTAENIAKLEVWQAIFATRVTCVMFLKQIVKLHLVWSSLELTFCWTYISPHLFMSSIKSNQLPFVKFKHNTVSISSHIVMLAATKVNGEVF